MLTIDILLFMVIQWPYNSPSLTTRITRGIRHVNISYRTWKDKFWDCINWVHDTKKVAKIARNDQLTANLWWLETLELYQNGGFTLRDGMSKWSRCLPYAHRIDLLVQSSPGLLIYSQITPMGICNRNYITPNKCTVMNKCLAVSAGYFNVRCAARFHQIPLAIL